MIYVMDIPLMTEVKTVMQDVKKILAENHSQLLGKMRSSGSTLQIACPFHAGGVERHPSCGVLLRPKKSDDGKVIPAGTFHCFTCGTSGTLPELVSSLFGYSDGGFYGYKWLVSHYCAVSVEKRAPIDLPFSLPEVPEEPIVTEEELQKYRFFHPYMWERKLTERVVTYFDVGYDKESNCLTFPVKDLFGDVRFIQRRSVAGKFFQFDDAVSKGHYLYGLYEASLNPEKRIIITEAPIDALTAWIRGYAGIATCGLPIDPRQLGILQNYPAREYIVATDADAAGEAAANLLKRKLNKVLWRMTFNGKKDLNEMNEEDWGKVSLKLI